MISVSSSYSYMSCSLTFVVLKPSSDWFLKKSWIEGTESANHYQQIHLPYVVLHFWGVWDTPISRGMDPWKLTPTVLDLVKSEIIDLMVRMIIFPSSMLQYIAVRRSRRNTAVSDSAGFHAMDLFFEITDHAFPWWKKGHDDPASRFPNTWKFIQEEMEDKVWLRWLKWNETGWNMVYKVHMMK